MYAFYAEWSTDRTLHAIESWPTRRPAAAVRGTPNAFNPPYAEEDQAVLEHTYLPGLGLGVVQGPTPGTAERALALAHQAWPRPMASPRSHLLKLAYGLHRQ